MAEPARKLMTVSAFVEWDDGTDLRYELIGGVPVAMAPPWSRHRTIVGNLAREAANRLLARSPCRVEIEAGIAWSEHDFFVADIAVTCEPPGNSAWVEVPTLLIEVLSPTTRRDDLSIKVPAYQRITSLREIWLVDSERRHVQQWRRDGARRWIVEDIADATRLPSVVLGSEIDLDAIYLNVALEEP